MSSTRLTDLDRRLSISNNKNFFAGLVFVFFGALAVILARKLPMGTLAQMGPGFFPTVLGGALLFLGLIITISALIVGREAIGTFAFRPLFFTLSSILVFALILESAGLILASLTLVGISCCGSEEFRFREMVILALLLTAFVVIIFVHALGLPFKVWPI